MFHSFSCCRFIYVHENNFVTGEKQKKKKNREREKEQKMKSSLHIVTSALLLNTIKSFIFTTRVSVEGLGSQLKEQITIIAMHRYAEMGITSSAKEDESGSNVCTGRMKHAVKWGELSYVGVMPSALTKGRVGND